MALPLLIAIAVLQWLVITLLPNVEPQFNHTTFLYGNLQIIGIIWVYQVINKYIKL